MKHIGITDNGNATCIPIEIVPNGSISRIFLRKGFPGVTKRKEETCFNFNIKKMIPGELKPRSLILTPSFVNTALKILGLPSMRFEISLNKNNAFYILLKMMATFCGSVLKLDVFGLSIFLMAMFSDRTEFPLKNHTI